MPPFVFVGASDPAKTVVPNSPSYGVVPVPPVTQRGILSVQLDEKGEGAPSLAHFLELGGVQWLEWHPSNGLLYGVWDDKLGAFAVAADGSLKLTSSVACEGGAHYVEISQDGAWALTVGYMSRWLFVYPIAAADGSLGAAVDSRRHEATVVPELQDRQEQAHPHQVRVDPRTQKWALCCDLGADKVMVYGFDTASGRLSGDKDSGQHVTFPQGAGPRHMDFHPGGKWAFVLCELNGNLVTCDWDGEAGTLTPKSTVYMLPEGKACLRAPHSGGCSVRVAPDGRHIYTSHRTDDTVVVFAVDESDGTLTKVQAFPCGGVTPRDINLIWPKEDEDAKMRFLQVVNQDSQDITFFPIGADGLLAETPAATLAIPGACAGTITTPRDF